VVNIYPLVRKCISNSHPSSGSKDLSHALRPLHPKRVSFAAKGVGEFGDKPFFGDLSIEMNLLWVTIAMPFLRKYRFRTLSEKGENVRTHLSHIGGFLGNPASALLSR